MLKSGARFALFGLLVGAALHEGTPAAVTQRAAASASMPVFQVDPAWLKLPNNWVLGVTSSITVDRHDHVWILHRSRGVQEAMRSRAAPPVLEFDANGQFVNAWGGDGQGDQGRDPGSKFDWPGTEHGIAVDHKDNVWISGSGNPATPDAPGDDMVLKFTRQGKFLMQIGGRATSKGNLDTRNVHLSADVFVWPKTNELFVADGYGNRRVIVFNPENGAFKRMWGAFGSRPVDAPITPVGGPPAGQLDTEGPGPQLFSNPVHAVKVSNDGLVYVADRSNRRIQIFTTEGKYLNQVFINRSGPAGGSAAGIAFSPDRDQQFLYVADFGNSHILVLNRKTLEVLYQFGTRSPAPGDFQGAHHIAVDSKGNLYVAEVAPGNRAQKFLLKGMSTTPPPNAVAPAKPSTAQ